MNSKKAFSADSSKSAWRTFGNAKQISLAALGESFSRKVRYSKAKNWVLLNLDRRSTKMSPYPGSKKPGIYSTCLSFGAMMVRKNCFNPTPRKLSFSRSGKWIVLEPSAPLWRPPKSEIDANCWDKVVLWRNVTLEKNLHRKSSAVRLGGADMSYGIVKYPSSRHLRWGQPLGLINRG